MVLAGSRCLWPGPPDSGSASHQPGESKKNLYIDKCFDTVHAAVQKGESESTERFINSTSNLDTV